MTKSRFIELCGEYTIDVSIAIESEQIQEALRGGIAGAVEQAFKNEF